MKYTILTYKCCGSIEDLTLEYDEENSILTTTTLNTNIVTTNASNSFGEVTTRTATYSSSNIYTEGFEYDKASRITEMNSKSGSDSWMTLEYGYDSAGRLYTVYDGVTTAAYTYDDNGNRLSYTSDTMSGEYMYGIYDDQDRLTEYGDGSSTTTYTYDYSGRLISKTDGNTTTSYTYNYQGYLEKVLEVDASTTLTYVEYENDVLGRRIQRKLNGAITNRWLYGGFLSPIAELDGDGDVKYQYIFGTRLNVPDYIIDHSDNGKKYRVITNYLGSVIRVVNAQTGVTTQSMTYDEYGNVNQNSGSILPLGFCGGIYDSETGLNRFGFREYDASIGRWITKDPIGFLGGINLYVYNKNDSINRIDPTGLGSNNASNRTIYILIGDIDNSMYKPPNVDPKNSTGATGYGMQFALSATIHALYRLREIYPNANLEVDWYTQRYEFMNHANDPNTLGIIYMGHAWQGNISTRPDGNKTLSGDVHGGVTFSNELSSNNNIEFLFIVGCYGGIGDPTGGPSFGDALDVELFKGPDKKIMIEFFKSYMRKYINELEEFKKNKCRKGE